MAHWIRVRSVTCVGKCRKAEHQARCRDNRGSTVPHDLSDSHKYQYRLVHKKLQRIRRIVSRVTNEGGMAQIYCAFLKKACGCASCTGPREGKLTVFK